MSTFWLAELQAPLLPSASGENPGRLTIFLTTQSFLHEPDKSHFRIFYQTA
jgi:hypothetical protein